MGMIRCFDCKKPIGESRVHCSRCDEHTLFLEKAEEEASRRRIILETMFIFIVTIIGVAYLETKGFHLAALISPFAALFRVIILCQKLQRANWWIGEIEGMIARRCVLKK